MQVAGGEALEPERIEEARVLADEDLRDLPADADHLVPVVRVEDPVDVGADEVEDGEVVDGESAHAARARNLVQRPATFEAAHGVREAGAPEIGEARVDVGRARIGIELDVAVDDERLRAALHAVAVPLEV